MNVTRAISFLGGAALLATGFLLGQRTRPTRGEEVARESSPATQPSTPATRPSRHASPTNDPAAERAAPGHRVSDTLRRLTGLQIKPQDPRSARALLHELEILRTAGPAALPAIGDFLRSGEDIDYDAIAGKIGRDGVMPLDFLVPPSLRLGLLEVVKNIGGAEAEQLLLRELQTSGRGAEVAYLGRALQEIAADRYREPTLAAARDLLAMPLTTRTKNPLDRADREYLYGVLTAAGDRSQISAAQAQLLLPNGQIDQGALRYLRQMLGDEVVSIAAQAWQDPRVAGNQREPLARTALAYVGVTSSAEELYKAALADPALSDHARKDLIEDLNQAGFRDPKHLTPADLPLIEKRLALIEQLAPNAKDRTSAAAFVEARKDLQNMRDAVLAASAPKR